ncbi:MAG: GDCCVxC domain-containing (seleno)protein [Paracoccaceae bacterium]|nr:GDCCVxC domain-containing (seleno)protein [Paracoccaceae bacterium]MDG2258513.1 GDCCVxC domain-containing (seleno)protein [Paracoccaceae bacterium]
MTEVILQTQLTCPHCGAVHQEQMPEDTCQWFYECSACLRLLTPLQGDCCVYCSYADQVCPPLQTGGSCCDRHD